MCIQSHFNLAARIQKRLVAIVKDFPARPRPKLGPKIDKMSLDHTIILSSHTIYRRGGRFYCARCRQSHPRAGVEHWPSSSCNQIGTSSDKPTPLEFGRYRAGNQVAHFSHSLLEFRGLVYCRKCGFRSHTKMHNLARPCLPDGRTVTNAGKANINEISKGLLPYNQLAWPDESVFDHVTTQVCGKVSFRTVEQMTDFTASYNLMLHEETQGAANSSCTTGRPRPEVSQQLVPHDNDRDSLSSD